MSTKARRTFVIVLRHVGLEREIAIVKINGTNLYAFTPYSLSGLVGLDNHVSYHSSGERHVTSRYRVAGRMYEDPGSRRASLTQLAPPEELMGAVPIYHGGDPFGQFPELSPAGTTFGQRVLIDGEKAGFREGFWAVRIYAVELHNEKCVPISPGAHPRVLRFVRTTNPWLAIEVFPQAGSELTL